MKHLKKYNEAVGGVNGVNDFCEGYLANILDDDSYQFNVTEQMSGHRVSPSYYFSLYKVGNGAYDIIQWDEIKDQFIPFLHMLIREYSIEPMRLIDQSKLTYQTKNVYIDDNPRNRTIQFNRYLPDTYSSDLYYMDVRNVIKDEDVPEQFYRIQIQFY
jgi:hypothetical protein